MSKPSGPTSEFDSHFDRVVHDLQIRGIGFRCIDQYEIDTTTASEKLLFNILAAIAEFEIALRAERQVAGIALAKVHGTRFGRPAKSTETAQDDIRQLRASHMLIREIITRQASQRRQSTEPQKDNLVMMNID